MAQILKGGPVSKKITEELIARCGELKTKGIEPCLALVRIGEKPDDISYENSIEKRCEKIGIKIQKFLFKEDVSKDEILDAIQNINQDKSINGCLMFRPFPNREIENLAGELLDSKKDMDGQTAGSFAYIYSGQGEGYAPCTAASCMEILKYYGIDPEGKRAAVLGRSLVIGRPVAQLLMAKGATVTICHSKTKDANKICKDADILVAALGKAEMVDGSYIKEKSVVLDVGINVTAEGNLLGDVNFAEAENIADAITPVPGGVGSVTTAVLAKHVIEAAEKTCN